MLCRARAARNGRPTPLGGPPATGRLSRRGGGNVDLMRLAFRAALDRSTIDATKAAALQIKTKHYRHRQDVTSQVTPRLRPPVHSANRCERSTTRHSDTGYDCSRHSSTSRENSDVDFMDLGSVSNSRFPWQLICRLHGLPSPSS